MVLRNLFRRRGRTALTLLGIAIGVAAIVALGAVAGGLRQGFASMTRGSEADFIVTQAGALTAILGSIDQAVADELQAMPEVAAVDGLVFANTILDDGSYLFCFGLDPQGFSIRRFRVIEGERLDQASVRRGRPLLLGRQAAERLHRKVGDLLHIGEIPFRIVGLYETGSNFEDSAAVVSLEDAQTLTVQPRRVTLLYVKLRDPAMADAFRARMARRFPDLSVITTVGFADQEYMVRVVDAMAMAVAGLAVVIGGVGMTNTLFMSVFERTTEIGVLRALGWRRRRVVAMVLQESLALSLLGGLAGIALGVAAALLARRAGGWIGAWGNQFTPEIFFRALVTVGVLGLVGGAYPAWWASRLQPVEAMRYEGGAGGRVSRPLPGGMPLRNLLRRRTRTALTTLGIAIGIAAVVALGGMAEGMYAMFSQIWRDSQVDLIAMQANVDSDFSAIDERVGSRLAAMPEVEAVAGVIFAALSTEKMPMFLLSGYHPRSFVMGHFRIVEGSPLTGPRQILVGRRAAEQMGLKVGDTLRLQESTFRVVGIYETGVAYEDIGAVVSLREAQVLTGKPRQVQIYYIKLKRPQEAASVRDRMKAAFPGVDFALTTEAEQVVSDLRVMQQMVGQISFLAVFIGAVGMLNTMLMSVLERTREIGVLRALGWRRRRVLGMILRESLLLGILGGLCGTALGVLLAAGVARMPGIAQAFTPLFKPTIFLQAAVVSLVAGALGGLYPAWRATRMRPAEALRYE
ncbi:MAG: ABC transporter permease [Anaerolineae bacterium]|nr:ABC transporter permease [Anaerolineae bacterium]MDW8068881.1 ABC transporter permease [Anaerolineae bacterium]